MDKALSYQSQYKALNVLPFSSSYPLSEDEENTISKYQKNTNFISYNNFNIDNSVNNIKSSKNNNISSLFSYNNQSIPSTSSTWANTQNSEAFYPNSQNNNKVKEFSIIYENYNENTMNNQSFIRVSGEEGGKNRKLSESPQQNATDEISTNNYKHSNIIKAKYSPDEFVRRQFFAEQETEEKITKNSHIHYIKVKPRLNKIASKKLIEEYSKSKKYQEDIQEYINQINQVKSPLKELQKMVEENKEFNSSGLKKISLNNIKCLGYEAPQKIRLVKKKKKKNKKINNDISSDETTTINQSFNTNKNDNNNNIFNTNDNKNNNPFTIAYNNTSIQNLTPISYIFNSTNQEKDNNNNFFNTNTNTNNTNNTNNKNKYTNYNKSKTFTSESSLSYSDCPYTRESKENESHFSNTEEEEMNSINKIYGEKKVKFSSFLDESNSSNKNYNESRNNNSNITDITNLTENNNSKENNNNNNIEEKYIPKNEEEKAVLEWIKNEEEKLPVPINMKDNEKFKILTIQRMKRKSTPANKSVRKYNFEGFEPVYEKEFRINNQYSNIKKKKNVYSCKKLYVVNFNLTSQKGHRLSFLMFRDSEIGIGEYWQMHLHEANNDEDVETDEEQKRKAQIFSLREVDEAIEDIRKEKEEAFVNFNRYGGKWMEEIAEEIVRRAEKIKPSYKR